MAEKEPELAVHYRDFSLNCLREIWNWNAAQYGPDRADSYGLFLEDRADALATNYLRGRKVPNRESYRYIVAKKRSRGHGHLIIYMILESRIEILAFYHTRQDWQGKIDRGEI